MPVRRGKTAVLVVLAVLTLAGLGLRVGYALDQPYSPPPDAGAYARIAENLQRARLLRRPARGVPEVQPSSAYAPGLPLLAGRRLLDHRRPPPHPVLILLALIGAAAVPLAYLLGRRLSGSRGPDRRRSSPSTRRCSSTRGCS